MFDRIKDRLKNIENSEEISSEDKEELTKIMNTIKQIKNEIIQLEEITADLIDKKEQLKEDTESEIDMGFLSKIQSARVNIETIVDKGWNYIVAGKYKEAIEILRRGKKMYPENIKVHNLLGWAYIHLEQFDKASVTFQKVLNIDAKNEMAQANLGYINYKKGLYGEAIERLSNIVSNAKNKQATLYALYYLGLVYFERNMYNDSIEFLNKAIALGPNLYEAYYYLGKAYQKRGLRNLSHQIWKKLIDLNAYNIWAKKAREELDDK